MRKLISFAYFIDVAGVNKPFDRILKAFVDEAPDLFLRLLGVVPPEATVRMSPLRPETAPAVAMPDFVALLTVDGGEPFLFHVEFFINYFSGIPSTMAQYGVSLAWQHGRRVLSLVVLLRPQGVPKALPRIGRLDIGDTKTRHPFRVVRLWKIDPALILESRDWRLLPWAVLMKASDAEVRRAAAILAREGDEESIGRFVTLGSLRYDRSHLEEMLGDAKMGLIEAILEGSSLVREVVDKAAQEGRAEGRAEGRTEGDRLVLRRVLKAKFPGLDEMPEIQLISSIEALESLVETASTATDRGTIELAISTAARTN